ncbi:hypothetical protein L1049_021366 [Liquidambar formosana]|uniref:Uncharacterized protein n=1 Tax=Liquidambar formosana TaxID=63359 RepID=A0AAP0N420_LIQFO
MATSIPITNVNHATVTLQFTDQMVQACMAMDRSAGLADKPSPSPFEVLAGLFWVHDESFKENGLSDAARARGEVVVKMDIY